MKELVMIAERKEKGDKHLRKVSKEIEQLEGWNLGALKNNYKSEKANFVIV